MQWARRGNHFRLLVRVPERPAGFDVPLEQVMSMMDRAAGADEGAAQSIPRVGAKRGGGGEAGIEAWRRRILARMFCLRWQAVQSGVAEFRLW